MSKNKRTVLEPSKEIPVIGEADVVVVGGGIAGSAAAIAASRNGADVCIVEKDVNRLAIGIGMMPRNVVTLTMADIGVDMGVLSQELFSAIIMMVAIAALVGPLLLRLVLSERRGVVGAGGLIPTSVSDETRKVNLRLKRLGRK